MQYLASWLSGNGAAAIFNLMEDAATAEIARAQIWFWINRRGTLDDGRKITRELYLQLRDEEAGKLPEAHLAESKSLLDGLVLHEEFPDFLTLGAYEKLD